MTNDITSEQKPRLKPIFWITLIRGFMVILLGLSLILSLIHISEPTRPY